MTAQPDLSTEDLAELSDLIRRWYSARYAMNMAAEEEASLAELLRKYVPDGGTQWTDDGTLGVSLVPGAMRFDARRAREVLTPEQLALISEPVPQAERARKLLHPELLRLVLSQNKSSLRPLMRPE
jgi:hypothetical protein